MSLVNTEGFLNENIGSTPDSEQVILADMDTIKAELSCWDKAYEKDQKDGGVDDWSWNGLLYLLMKGGDTKDSFAVSEQKEPSTMTPPDEGLLSENIQS